MTENPAIKTVLANMDSVRPWAEDFYRDLHAHPELSNAEFRTSKLVSERLREFGFEVHEGIGGTGVVGTLTNGEGPRILVRADMDALPVQEATGLDYASKVVSDGTPVMHACGHDVHVTCLLGAATLLAQNKNEWSGTLITLFQPAEETAGGAQAMVDDGVTSVVGTVDAALAQHVFPFPSGTVATRQGPVMTTADSMRITVHGRGSHGSMPEAAVDPVVLAALIVVRLQTIVARQVAPSDTVALTVGSIQAGTKSNVIPDYAVLELNLRTYDADVRSMVIESIKRIVRAECDASQSPKEPEFELFDHFPLTDNDPEVTGRVTTAFADHFGDRAVELPQLMGSEDFSELPDSLGAPYTYWALGGADPDVYRQAAEAGRVAQDIPVNHSALFAPVIQPTLDTGTEAIVAAALAWLAVDEEDH